VITIVFKKKEVKRLQLVEQHVIGKNDPRYSVIVHVAPERSDAKKRTG
jgi:hypothetical protein